jgi:hypothetical protein
LKYLSLVEKKTPLVGERKIPRGLGASTAPSPLMGHQAFPFIGQGKAMRTRERKEKKKKEKTMREPLLGAALPSPFSRGTSVL